MPRTSRDPGSARHRQAIARVACYLLGPFSGLVLFSLRAYSQIWSIRFHAIHSILMSGAWACAWAVAKGLEHLAPWFLAAVLREIRLAMNLAFATIWIGLMATAYGGRRFAVIPLVHGLSVKLARRFAR